MAEKIFQEVIVELSHNCNLSCVMCGYGCKINPFAPEKFLSFENYQKILQQIGPKTKRIRLNGRGESTLHPQFGEILDYTRAFLPEVEITLFSNFSFANEQIMASLIRNKVYVFISMDSPVVTELEKIRAGANFALIEDNVAFLQKSTLRPAICFTLQETNWSRILPMAKFALKHNCQLIFNAVTYSEPKKTRNFVTTVKKNLRAITEQFEAADLLYKNSGLACVYPDQIAGVAIQGASATPTHQTLSQNLGICPSLKNELCILHDGTVIACGMFNDYEYGNIFQQTLPEIWHGRQRRIFLRGHRNHQQCKNCANCDQTR